MHVETASSISSLDNVPMSTYAEKFNDTNVVRTVNSTIKAMIGMDCEYGKMLVIGNTNHPGQFEKMDGIKIISFENILLEVMNDMNKQSYRNEITRTLQLVKYLLLAKPSKMAAVIGYEGSNKIFTRMEREEFLRMLLQQKDVRRIMGKKSMEHEIASILTDSTLSQPENLAEAIEGSMMTKRAQKKFERIIMARQEVKIKVEKKELRPKEQKLEAFFEN